MNTQDNTPIVRLAYKAKGAFLGAALGDALGWPQEMRSRKWERRDTAAPVLRQWVRRAGGRFNPHIEVILPGEYSDDTQLILSTARALVFGDKWWQFFRQVELPFWLQYERGGGGATKRAAELWSKKQPPWEAPGKQRNQYFQAGGNGVAMRVLPHSVNHARTLNFGPLARDIVLNGITTHGHPRALVGSLLYGFVLWKAMQTGETLEFGQLINWAIQSVDVWSKLPYFEDICPGWTHAVTTGADERFDILWKKTVQEQTDLLAQCEVAITKGALSVDQETLHAIGCFDKRQNGSGTVAAAASIFLASRFAPDPINGVAEAAFADGADTDTIASMTGGLLGAIRGPEWLSRYENHIQDDTYLNQCAATLANPALARTNLPAEQPVFRDIRELLEASQVGAPVSLPDGRIARLIDRIEHETSTKSITAMSWKIKTDDGQTLYIKRVSRNKRSGVLRDDAQQNRERRNLVVKVGVKIPVRDLLLEKRFYHEVLGLAVQKSSPTFVNLAGCIALVVEKDESPLALTASRSIVYMEVASITHLFSSVSAAGAKIVSPIATSKNQRMFRCLDPEENIVEIVESILR